MGWGWAGRKELAAGNKKPLLLNRDLAQAYRQLAVLGWLWSPFPAGQRDQRPRPLCQGLLGLWVWSPWWGRGRLQERAMDLGSFLQQSQRQGVFIPS